MSTTAPARKSVKMSQLPGDLAGQPANTTQQDQHGQPASIYTVAMTAINFVTFLFSLVAVDIHYTIRRSTLGGDGSKAQGILPKWLYRLLHPWDPYETYYHTKQRKLMRMEAEDAFRLRNRTLIVMAASMVATVIGTWWLLTRIWQGWIHIMR